MGMYHSTYHFFGAHVPESEYDGHAWTEAERLDGVIAALGDRAAGVGHITAGTYDHDMLFLCVVPDGVDCSVELGKFARVSPETDLETLSRWTALIRRVAEARGYHTLGEPGWIVVPDLS